jgi:hypothetical protein
VDPHPAQALSGRPGPVSSMGPNHPLWPFPGGGARPWTFMFNALRISPTGGLFPAIPLAGLTVRAGHSGKCISPLLTRTESSLSPQTKRPPSKESLGPASGGDSPSPQRPMQSGRQAMEVNSLAPNPACRGFYHANSHKEYEMIKHQDPSIPNTPFQASATSAYTTGL